MPCVYCACLLTAWNQASKSLMHVAEECYDEEWSGKDKLRQSTEVRSTYSTHSTHSTYITYSTHITYICEFSILCQI